MGRAQGCLGWGGRGAEEGSSVSNSFVVISLEPHRYLHLTGIKRWLWTCGGRKKRGKRRRVEEGPWMHPPSWGVWVYYSTGSREPGQRNNACNLEFQKICLAAKYRDLHSVLMDATALWKDCSISIPAWTGEWQGPHSRHFSKSWEGLGCPSCCFQS